jgi:hypothetical protein
MERRAVHSASNCGGGASDRARCARLEKRFITQGEQSGSKILDRVACEFC